MTDPILDITDPQVAIRRLAEIEEDIANRQNDYEKAAGDHASVIREWKKRFAQALVGANGSSKEIRESQALLAIVASGDDLYERLTTAESDYAALKVVVETLTERASIVQSVLKAQTKQAYSSRSGA